MIHVRSCFYFLNLPTGSLVIAVFFLVNSVLWLSINVGKYMSPTGRHLILGTPMPCSCGCSYGCEVATSRISDDDDLKKVIEREQRSTTQETQGQAISLSLVDQNSSKSIGEQTVLVNESAIVEKDEHRLPEKASENTDIHTKPSYDGISASQTDGACDCGNELADIWFWAVSAVHILGAVIALVFHCLLIYGLLTRKYTVICTWTIYSWIYWIFLFAVSLISLVILSVDTNTNNVHLLIRFFITVIFLSLMMYCIIVVNSHRVAVKHSKRNLKRVTKICYSPSSSSTTPEDSVVEFYE